MKTPDTEKCEHKVVKKYCFRCKRPDLAGNVKNTPDTAHAVYQSTEADKCPKCGEDHRLISRCKTPDTEIIKAVPLPHEPAVTTNGDTNVGGGSTPDTNYCDSMTPEEREAQSKIEVETTYSKDTGEVLVVKANGVEVYPTTPDTEMEKMIIYDHHIARINHDKKGNIESIVVDIPPVLKDLLTSRDTYWAKEKERAYFKGYNAGLADGTGAPLIVIEKIREERDTYWKGTNQVFVNNIIEDIENMKGVYSAQDAITKALEIIKRHTIR